MTGPFGQHGAPRRPVTLITAIRRGFRHRCPRCGSGGIYRAYVKVREACPSCELGLSRFRTDDAPPYFTILLVGHIVVPGMLLLEQFAHPPAWVQTAIWVPATLFLSLALLPRVKGALLGLHWIHDLGR